MNADKMFKVLNITAVIPWLLMAVLPNWSYTKLIINNHIFPLAFVVFYILFLSQGFGKTKGNFSTLDGLGLLFRNKNLLLAGWIHYLAFDLFVGSWEFNDSMISGVPHWALVPCLFFTLMFGPVGLGMYVLVRLAF